jgi:hypothetical protein
MTDIFLLPVCSSLPKLNLQKVTDFRWACGDDHQTLLAGIAATAGNSIDESVSGHIAYTRYRLLQNIRRDRSWPDCLDFHWSKADEPS